MSHNYLYNSTFAHRMKQFLVIILIVSFGACSKYNKVLKSSDIDYKYRMALKYYEKKKYKYAQELFIEIMPFYKDKKEFPEIYYKYAYTAYYQKDYFNAENLFKGFIEAFPANAWAEEMEYMRAFSFYKQSPKPELDQTNTLKTIGLMQAFIGNRPNSARIEEATTIIDVCRQKLEDKEFKNAQLYYDIGYHKSAAIAFDNLIVNFPDSKKADLYKLMVIKAYYRYAKNSVEDKKVERIAYALGACDEFNYRFADSPLKTEVDSYYNLLKNL
jgi:outer membrane protein assembly factor BamD